MLNAFCILLIFTSIFAIIGTNVFAGRSEDFFGNFLKSMFTLFQIATGDSWASSIARSLFTDNDRINFWVSGGEGRGKKQEGGERTREMR